MKKQFSLLEGFIEQGDVLNESVSASPVIWHVAHSIKVINSISKALKNSNADDYKPRFNLMSTIVLSAGTIPRGRGKAPKRSMPDDNIDVVQLKQYLEKAKEEFKNLKKLDAKSYFDHPYFGQLNLKKTRRFIRIHTKHHIKIIQDIIK